MVNLYIRPMRQCYVGDVAVPRLYAVHTLDPRERDVVTGMVGMVGYPTTGAGWRAWGYEPPRDRDGFRTRRDAVAWLVGEGEG